MMLKHPLFRQVRICAAVAASRGAVGLRRRAAAAPPRRRRPPPNVTVYAYPQQGQSPQQMDRDRYECSTWATQQTGFNPSAPNVPPHERVQVVSGPPPGTGVAVGAVTGGILGAAVSNPRNAGAGLLLGALLGGAIGAGAEASADAQAQARGECQRQCPHAGTGRADRAQGLRLPSRAGRLPGRPRLQRANSRNPR